METLFGITTGRGAEAFAEVDSFYSKITTDGSVTDLVAAWNQIVAKFGIC